MKRPRHQAQPDSPVGPSSLTRVLPGAVWYVGLGGAVGTLTRVLLIGVDPSPSGILLVNTLGSVVFGVVAGLLRPPALDRVATERWWLILGPGVCGGFTSLSAVAVILLAVTQQASLVQAALYLVVILAAGTGGFWAGQTIPIAVRVRIAARRTHDVTEGSGPHAG